MSFVLTEAVVFGRLVLGSLRYVRSLLDPIITISLGKQDGSGSSREAADIC